MLFAVCGALFDACGLLVVCWLFVVCRLRVVFVVLFGCWWLSCVVCC